MLISDFFPEKRHPYFQCIHGNTLALNRTFYGANPRLLITTRIVRVKALVKTYNKVAKLYFFVHGTRNCFSDKKSPFGCWYTPVSLGNREIFCPKPVEF